MQDLACPLLRKYNILVKTLPVAVVAEKHVIVNAPPREVIGFDHPFVRTFFLGGRGLRAMELLRLHPQDV